MRAKVSIFVRPNRCFLILSTTIKPELSVNSQLYTPKARGKCILKNTSGQNISHFCENMHLPQLVEVDEYMKPTNMSHYRQDYSNILLTSIIISTQRIDELYLLKLRLLSNGSISKCLPRNVIKNQVPEI